MNLLILNFSSGAWACKYKSVLRHTDFKDLLCVCNRHASWPDRPSSSRCPGILRDRAVCVSELAPGKKVDKKHLKTNVSGGRPLFRTFLECASAKCDLGLLPGHSACWRPCCLPSKAGMSPETQSKHVTRQVPRLTSGSKWVGENVTGNLPNKGQYDLKWSSTVCSNGYQGVINYNLTEFVEELLTW